MISSEFKRLKDNIKKTDVEVRIVSDSMTPFIKVGQKVNLTHLTRPLRPFDLIVFLGADKKLICHFVIKVLGEHVLTTNSKSIKKVDPPVLQENILGLVTNIKLSKFFKFKTILYYLLFMD